jgi:class 3 adenylate cyclase/tetratricopeptide (TPR) repeat protein
MSEEVSKWLNRLGLGQYSAVFEENAVEVHILPDLTDTDLKELGISALGHRKLILKSISTFQPEQSATLSEADKQATGDPPTHPSSDEDIAVWKRTPGERKPVTMLFADIVGSTALTEKLDAEDAHDLLYRATQNMCQAVEKNEGTVCRFMGDGIMAMFGAPNASERHALEACLAALAMQNSIDEYANELEANHDTYIQIRVGLHSGEVVVLEVGDDPDKPEYDASGPTVPLAARMEQSATAGTILITEETRALAGDLIETNKQPAVKVKGVSEPVVVHQLYKVLSATELSTIAARRPIVGRKSELAQFRGLLEACLESGHGQTVFVRGAAGIGKTRLVEEMTRLAQERGFTSHKVLVLDFGAGKGQEAVPSLVRRLLGIAQGCGKRERESALDQAELDGIVDHDSRVFLNDFLDLGQPLELRTLYDAMDAQARKEGKRKSVVDMLIRLAARKCVLIVVEDLHWADINTLDYLARLATTVAECPALLVLTSRAEGDPIDTSWRARAGETPIVTWDLSPLRREEAVKLVSTFIDASDSLAKRCIERAAGNPLFLEQLLLSVVKGVSESVPDSIKSLVLARMDQLPREDKQALQAAAVLGQRFDLESLRFLINEPKYECKNLVERHLLRPEGPLYLFAHALIQEGAYASLVKRQRNQWHKLAANWFSESDLILHAEHLDQAGDNSAPTAYLAAARERFTQFRPEQALQMVRRGLAIKPNSEIFNLKCLEGELLRVLGNASESIVAYQSADEAATDGIQRCRALVGVAEGLRVTEEHEKLIKVLATAEALAKNHELNFELALINYLRAGVLFFRKEIEACSEASYTALHHARNAKSLELEALALSSVADVEYLRENYSSAFRNFDQCVELAREHGFGRVLAANLSMRGWLSHWKNDFEAKSADYHEAVELAAKTRDLRSEMIALSGGTLWAEMGDFTKSNEWLQRGMAIVAQLGSKLFEGEYHYLLGRVKFMEGDHVLSRKHAQEALSVFRESESGMTFRGPTALGICALTAESSDLRHSLLHEAEDLLPDCLGHNHLDFYEDAIQACLQAAEWDEVERYAQALEDYLVEDPLPRCTLIIARGRVLASHGRGNRDQTTMEELRRVHDKASQVSLKFTLPELEAALELG